MDADVTVVGAGPAGAAAALYLGRQGRRVVVLERQATPGDKPCGEGLMPPGVTVLRQLRLLQPLQARGAPPIRGVSFAANGLSRAYADFPLGRAGLGVRRLIFDQVLRQALQAEPNVELRQGYAATDVLWAPLRVTGAGLEVRTRTVIVADGLRSPLRKALGWEGRRRSPHRYGLTGHVRTADPPPDRIHIELCRGYEIFSAPSGPHQQLIAVLGSKAIFAGSDLERCYRTLTGRQGELTSAINATGPFGALPTHLAADGVFLAGDAAGFLDPITGQGMEMALLSARALAGIVGRMLDDELSAKQAARSYAAWHRRAWRDHYRLTRLVLWLTASEARVRRGLRGLSSRPRALQLLLGVNCGYWSLGRLRPRDWIALLAGV